MCVLFFVSPLLQLSNLLCAHRDQPLKTAAPGSFDSSFLWPTRIPAGAQRARGEGDWRAYFPVAPPALTWPWAKAASIYPGSQLLSGGLFPTAPDHLAHSSCQLGLNIAMLAHSWNHHSHLSKTSLCWALFSYPLRCHLPPAGTQAMLLRMQWWEWKRSVHVPHGTYFLRVMRVWEWDS